jgi:hypothetical protein
LKKLLILLGVSLVFLGIEIGVAYLIFSRSETPLQDILTMEGIVVGAVGMLASMKGASSGASISGIGSKYSDMAAFNNLQHVRLEREGDSYQKNFFQNAVVEYGLIRFAIMISGLMLLFCSFIFF